MSGRRVASAIRSPVNGRHLQLECVRDLHETLFVPFLMCDRSRIRAVKMENLRGLLGIRRMDSPECTNY